MIVLVAARYYDGWAVYCEFNFEINSELSPIWLVKYSYWDQQFNVSAQFCISMLETALLHSAVYVYKESS